MMRFGDIEQKYIYFWLVFVVWTNFLWIVSLACRQADNVVLANSVVFWGDRVKACIKFCLRYNQCVAFVSKYLFFGYRQIFPQFHKVLVTKNNYFWKFNFWPFFCFFHWFAERKNTGTKVLHHIFFNVFEQK